MSRVGRRSWRSRLAVALVYLGLTTGAVTTLYPFLLMVSTGFKGPTDQNDNKLVPAYWTDHQELLKKYVDDKYAGDLSMIDSTRIGADAPEAEVERYRTLLAGLGPLQWQAGFRTPANNVSSRLTARWRNWLREKYGDIDRLNVAYTELNTTFQSVSPPAENFYQPGWKPKTGPKWADWLEFKAALPVEFRVPIRAARRFQDSMRVKFANRIEDVPTATRRGAVAFEQLALAADDPEGAAFLASVDPNDYADLKFGANLPIAADESEHVASNSGEVRREMATRNHLYVLDYVLLHGRAVLNTVLFCALAIFTQLTVNPLAAYALSRFPMPSTAQILIFLLATMAFPAEVAMIPSFLLLKDLHLLNTFAALILPTAASGYMVFLLKGFFDSLPREVFDSGQVDGAPERIIMLKLAFPLAKPVLGYLALLAFMGAYGAFMYAFLVCQDQRMWTLMVYVYQLQLNAPKAVTMAAVTIAAIPTVVVFLLAQKVIMRGIVLPGER